QDRLRTLSQAILEARRRTDEARQEWIVEVLHRATDRLRAIRADPRYPRFLQAWITEAIGVLTADGGVTTLLARDEAFEVEVDPRDLPAASKVLGAQPTRARLVAGHETDGGVILRTADGAVVVVNTIDSRLERAAPEVRRRLAHMLLENLPEGRTGRTEMPRQWEGSHTPAG
ncbi:MAG: V-type ATP synthase subunit E, partial [Anaerolineales bacterium]